MLMDPVRGESRLEGERLSLHVEDASAVYPLEIDPLIWAQQDKLLASDGAAGDRFGRAVAVSGDTAVVGAVLDDDNGSFSGSAYVFVRSGSSWTLRQDRRKGDLRSRRARRRAEQRDPSPGEGAPDTRARAPRRGGSVQGALFSRQAVRQQGRRRGLRAAQGHADALAPGLKSLDRLAGEG
jgi:hypothetical protein